MEKKKFLMSSSFKFTIVAVILIALFCVALTPVTFQNDTYYTIKIGEHIQENGIDMKDPFSWHPDLDYTYPHWLYDFLTYQIYAIGGFTGIYIATCILSVILGISIYYINAKISKNTFIAFFITMGVMYLIEGYIAARAQLVTFILFIWIVYFIEQFLKTRKFIYGGLILAIATLIANLHVAVWPFIFILFLPYIGEYVIALLGDIIIYKKIQDLILKLRIKINNNPEKQEKIKEKQRLLTQKVEKIKIKRSKNLKNPYKIKMTRNDNCKWLILIMILCEFTGLLTPLGDTPYTYLVKTMQGNTTQNINEHLPMTIIDHPEVLCAIIIILSILTFTKTKIKLSDLFMIGGLTLLMLYTRRQLTMFTLIGGIILGKLIVELIEIYIKDGNKRIKEKQAKPVILFFIVALTISIFYNKGKEKINNEFVDESSYPVDACEFILDNIDLKTARFYNEYNYGSYMLFRGIPVFIDSRADLYAPEFSGLQDDIFMDFMNVSSIGDFYEDVFAKYNITHAIMTSNSKISMIIDKTNDPNYKKIYDKDNFVIYERLNAKKGDNMIDFSEESPENNVINQ